MFPWKSPRRSFSEPPCATSLLSTECASSVGPFVDPTLAAGDRQPEPGRAREEYIAGEALLQRLRESGL
jgi:hypothetical protein